MTVELRNAVVLVQEACVPCEGAGGRQVGLYESGWQPCGHCDGSGRQPPRAVPIDKFADALERYVLRRAERRPRPVRAAAA